MTFGEDVERFQFNDQDQFIALYTILADPSDIFAGITTASSVAFIGTGTTPVTYNTITLYTTAQYQNAVDVTYVAVETPL